jgi:hypothetical protein
VCFLIIGCSSYEGDVNESLITNSDISGINVRAAKVDISTGSITNDDKGTIIFSGRDISWFDEITKELRFKDNISNKPKVLNTSAISFYIDDEYLFSAMTYASGGSILQNYNGLVFYYNMTENKFYLESSNRLSEIILGDHHANDLPDITTEWNKFINQLKKEGLFKN